MTSGTPTRRPRSSGDPPEIVSERLGHANVAFTMQTYMHVIPGMDEALAHEVAALILGPAEAVDSGPLAEMDEKMDEGADE
jgi:hypothetical protein